MTSFAHAIASSSSAKRCTVTTGPKTSRCTISSVLADVDDDRRLDEEAAVAVRAAAGQDGRALRTLEEAEHAFLLRLRDHRAHLDLVALGRVADVQRLDGRDELLEQPVVDLRARRRRAKPRCSPGRSSSSRRS